MFNKTTLVLAASALLLSACGGGGGGGGAKETATPAAAAIRCNNGSTALTLAGGVALTTSNSQINTVVEDTAALVAGACLYQGFQNGGPNQFGGRSSTLTSVAETTDRLSCGVYTGAPRANVGGTLATTPSASDTVYCTVVRHSATVTSPAETTLRRHYFKIVPVTGFSSSAPVFQVTAFADQYTVVAGVQNILDNDFESTGQPRALQLRLTGSNGNVTAYKLSGQLPSTLLLTDGSEPYTASSTLLDVQGALAFSPDGLLAVAGFEGSSTVKPVVGAALLPDTFAAGSKIGIARSSGGGIPSIQTALLP